MLQATCRRNVYFTRAVDELDVRTQSTQPTQAQIGFLQLFYCTVLSPFHIRQTVKPSSRRHIVSGPHIFLFCCRRYHYTVAYIFTLCIFTVHDRLTLAIDEVAANKEKVLLQNNQISGCEQDIRLLRKQLEGLENEKEKDRKMIAELQEALTRAREVRTTICLNSYGKLSECFLVVCTCRVLSLLQ